MTPKNEGYPKSGLWKDALDRKAVKHIGKCLKKSYSSFESDKFVKAICKPSYFEMELKQRIHTIAGQLKEFLPDNYKRTIAIIIKTAPHLDEFANWVLLTYVENYGLEYFDDSIKAMETLTRFSTAEFAIRPFMIHQTDKMMPILNRFCKSNNEHIRRLAAEASRPRGVWVAHIDSFKKDATPVLQLLENLKADRSLYVRKAVANNINDISKDNPKQVIAVMKRWLKSGDEDTNWIVKHGMRTLIKQGHPKALELFGFESKPKLTVRSFSFDKKRIKIGQSSSLTVEIVSHAKKKQKLVIDYKLDYLKKNGNHSSKIFKLAERDISPGETIILNQQRSFKNMSTRKHYTGVHKVKLMISGQQLASFEFELL